MLKTVRCSPIMTGIDKSFDASIPQTIWKPEATRPYNTPELPSASPMPHLMAQHLHPETSCSTVRASRENQPHARPQNELRFLFCLVGSAHATDITSPFTSPLSWGWHFHCPSAPEKAGFNRGGDLGRTPVFHCCPLFHELFKTMKLF